MISRAILARGFLGSAVDLREPSQAWSIGVDELSHRSPFDILRKAEQQLADGDILAGYLAYECAQAVERHLDLPKPPMEMPAAAFALFSSSSSSDFPPFTDEATGLSLDERSPMSSEENSADRSQYAQQVEDIRQRITRGDVFQVNLSRRQTAWSAQAKPDQRLVDALPVEEALSAPFGALLDLGRYSVLSASPELFLSLSDRNLATEPVKGTRPRHDNPECDEALLQELLHAPKDRAENLMIADLMRNDLAKVCDDGTLREPVLCGARSFASVHHLYSRIEGTLRKDCLFADALKAAFPCGSVTGAPKLAAMDIIAELEGEGRGPYCGAIFAITKARATASVAIRTALIDNDEGRVDVRSGGGVTVLSDPEAEYQETVDKAYLYRMLTNNY
ncbi:MAG: anthranilate synthase component I family protein, partial [Pseudomonadota bacterium]